MWRVCFRARRFSSVAGLTLASLTRSGRGELEPGLAAINVLDIDCMRLALQQARREGFGGHFAGEFVHERLGCNAHLREDLRDEALGLAHQGRSTCSGSMAGG